MRTAAWTDIKVDDVGRVMSTPSISYDVPTGPVGTQDPALRRTWASHLDG